jgi:hypothetical protein
MRSLYFLCTGLVLFFHLLGWATPTNIDSDSALRCEGLTDSRQHIQIAMYTNGETSTGLVILADRHIRIKNLRTQVAHLTEAPTMLQWLSDAQTEVVSVQHADGANYKITWRVPIVPIGSFRSQPVTGELANAHCVVAGDWGSKLEEVIPQDLQNLKNVLAHQPADTTLSSVIALVHTSDYSDADKDGFYREILNGKDISPDVLKSLLEAIFSENTNLDLRSMALDMLGDNDTELTSTVANALARCQTCGSLDGKIWLRVYSLVRAQIQLHTVGALDSWKSFANLAFRDKSQSMPFLSDALALIFSSTTVLLSDDPDVRLGELADLITTEIPSEELSKSAGALLGRLIASPQFSTRTRRQLAKGLANNHARAARAEATLPIALQRQTLQKIMMKKIDPDDETMRQFHWMLAEEAVQKMAPHEVSTWVVSRVSDFAVIENALAWMADQKDPVPGGKIIISEILANVHNVNPNDIDFLLDGNERGVLHDIAMFSFSQQAKDLNVGFTTLVTLLMRYPLSSQLLQKIGMTLYESTVFSTAEAEELLTLVTKHPNYVEGTTDALPNGGMISIYLSRSLKQEKKVNAPPARFNVLFLVSLLRQIVETRHLDRDDPEIEKSALVLLKQVSTL